MTAYQRAAQMWSVLALAASNRQVLTYSMLAQLTGVPRRGLANCLNPIQSYCLLHDLPPLTALVVGEKSGRPGRGFIGAQDVPEAHQRVFSDLDWLGRGCPSPNDFKEAVSKRRLTSEVPPE
jgi:hypothetical protein